MAWSFSLLPAYLNIVEVWLVRVFVSAAFLNLCEVLDLPQLALPRPRHHRTLGSLDCLRHLPLLMAVRSS